MVLLCFSLENAHGIPAGGDGLHQQEGASGQDSCRLQPGWRDGGASGGGTEVCVPISLGGGGGKLI